MLFCFLKIWRISYPFAFLISLFIKQHNTVKVLEVNFLSTIRFLSQVVALEDEGEYDFGSEYQIHVNK